MSVVWARCGPKVKLRRFLWHEEIGSITTPPRQPPAEWNASPPQGYPEFPNQRFAIAGSHLNV